MLDCKRLAASLVQELDTNKNGVVDKQELAAALKLKPQVRELLAFYGLNEHYTFEYLDENGDNRLTEVGGQGRGCETFL